MRNAHCIPAAASVLMFIFLSCTASAYDFCVNSSYRYFDSSFSFNNTQYTINGTELCPYGCEGGKCSPTRSGDSTAFAIMFSLAALFFAYVGLNIGKDHAILSWLFLILGIVMVFVGIMSIVAINTYSEGMSSMLANTGYGVLIVMIFLIFYFFITVIRNVFGKVFPYGKTGHGN